MKPLKPVAGWKKGKSLPKNSKSQEASNSQQKKITHFFTKSNALDAGKSTLEVSPYFQPARQKQRVVSSTTEHKDVITISDSESDSETVNTPTTSKKTALPEVKFNNEAFKVTENEKIEVPVKLLAEDFNPDSNNTNQCNRNPNEKLPKHAAIEDDVQYTADKGNLTPETDSGEEFLSSLDIDEIISSQEKVQKDRLDVSKLLTPVKTPTTRRKNLGDGDESSSSKSGSGSSESKRTPTKMLKPKVNYFSPIRHLNKRSRSKSSNSQSPDRQSRQSSSSPFNKRAQNSQGSPVVKKLQYPSTVPYFLKNFNTVLNTVVHDDHYSYLINEDDWKRVETFNTLSSEAQCLYVRLFQRKWDWKPASMIKYPQISENLDLIFQELHEARFLIEITENQPELQDLLDLLNGEQIIELTKQMKVNSTKKTKENCKQALLNLVKNQQTLHGSSEDIIVKRALKLLGTTYQLEKECRNFFSRLFILYSPPQYWEDEQDQTSNQLLKILMNDMGKMEYPQYMIKKNLRIYSDRNALIKFHEAWTLHCEITAHLESKNWKDVIEIAQESMTELQNVLRDPVNQSHDKSLPTFLRVYTAGSVLTRVSWIGVDGFQKLKNYTGANEIIEALLSQEVYLPHYRGRWHERLAINMKHLKMPNSNIQRTLENALIDQFLQDAHKLTLSDRLGKVYEEITKPPKKKSKKEKEDSTSDKLVEKVDKMELFSLKHEIPTRKIEGEKLDHGKMGKSVFLGERDSSGSSTASSVELFAVEYYKKLGYTYGLHAEGSAVVSIYGLLCWDEIYYDKLTDVFHTPYQAFPLDMSFDEFYQRREDMFVKKFDLLRNTWSVDETLNVIDENWGKHLNKLSLVNWSVFPSIEHAKSLVKAMGLNVTAAICERLSKNFRHCRAGFPDLVVWNEEEFMFVEVKGPGDSLSTKQMLWIDFLTSIGAKAEVCHVVAVSNKRIRM